MSDASNENGIKRRLRTRSRDRQFPDTLEGFGYEFNENGELRHIATKKCFDFNVYPDRDSNQKHYEALGEVVTEHVYKLLENECGLIKLSIPTDVTKNEAHGFVFASPDALTNEKKLVVIIHGSGVVRAGQWARKLIINKDLQSGTQIPFINEAKKLGYGVLVMNTNQNSGLNMFGDRKTIRGSETSTKHADYVWKKYIYRAKAKHIAIIAHSFGGVCVLSLAHKFPLDFANRVFAIALTDSVHSMSHASLYKETKEHLIKVGRNWVTSSKDLDEPIAKRGSEDIECVSAGHTEHIMTSWCSFSSIFKFLSEKYMEAIENEELGKKIQKSPEAKYSGKKRPSLEDVLEDDNDSHDNVQLLHKEPVRRISKPKISSKRRPSLQDVFGDAKDSDDDGKLGLKIEETHKIVISDADEDNNNSTGTKKSTEFSDNESEPKIARNNIDKTVEEKMDVQDNTEKTCEESKNILNKENTEQMQVEEAVQPAKVISEVKETEKLSEELQKLPDKMEEVPEFSEKVEVSDKLCAESKETIKETKKTSEDSWKSKFSEKVDVSDNAKEVCTESKEIPEPDKQSCVKMQVEEVSTPIKGSGEETKKSLEEPHKSQEKMEEMAKCSKTSKQAQMVTDKEAHIVKETDL